MAASTGQINVAALDTVLKSIGTTYNALKALDSQMDATLISKFAKLAQGVNQFTNALLSVNVSGDVAAGIDKIKGVFAKVGELAKDLNILIGGFDSGPVTKFSNAFYRLLLSFKDIDKITLDASSLDGFKTFFVKMDEIFAGPLSTLGQRAPNIDSTLAFLNTFKNLFLGAADFIKAISSSAGVISVDSLTAVSTIFTHLNTFIGGLLKTIGGSNIKGIKDIQQNYTNVFSSVLLDITNFLKNISPFLTTAQALAFSPATLQVTLQALGNLFAIFNAFIEDLLKTVGGSNIRGVAVLLQKDYTSVIPVILGDLKKFLVDFIPFLTLVQSYSASGAKLESSLAYLTKVFGIVNTFIQDLLKTIGNSNIKGFFIVQKNYLEVVPVVLGSLGDFLTTITPLLEVATSFGGKTKNVETALSFISPLFIKLNVFVRDLLKSIGDSNIKGLIIIQKNYLDAFPIVLTNVAQFITTLVPLFAELTQAKLTPASVSNTVKFLQDVFAELNKFVGSLLATIGNSNIKGFFVFQKSYLDVFPVVLGEVAGFITALSPLFLSLATAPLSLSDVSNVTLFTSKLFTQLSGFVRDLLDVIGNSNIKGFFVFQKSYLDVFPLVLQAVAAFTGQIFGQFSLLLHSAASAVDVEKATILVSDIFGQLNSFTGALLKTIGNSNIKGFFVFQKSYLDVFPIVLKSIGDFLSVILPQITALTGSTASVSGAQLLNIQVYFTNLLTTFSDFTGQILKAVNTSNIRGFFVFQKDYSKIFVTVLSSLGDLLTSLTPLITALSASKGLSEDFAARTQFVRSLLDSLSQFISDIVDALPSRNLASIILVRKVFLDAIPLLQGLVGSVTDLVKVVAKNAITAATAAAFETVLNSLLSVIREIYTFTVQASNTDIRKVTTLLPTLLSPIETFARVMTAFGSLNSDIKVNALQSLFGSLLETVNLVQNATTQIAARIGSDGYIKTFFSMKIFLGQTLGVLGSIQEIFSNVSLQKNSSASYKAIADVFANIPALLGTVQTVVTEILSQSAFAQGNNIFTLAGLAIKYQVIFGAVRSLLDIFNQYLVNIGALKGVSPTLITSITQIFTAARDVVTAVLSFELPSGFIATVKALFQYGIVLPMILSSVKSLTDFFGILEAAKGVDPKSVQALGQMFNAVRELATTLLSADTWTKLAANAPNWSQGVKTVIGAIRSVSDLVIGLLEAARTVPSESIAGLGNIFKGLGELFPGLASIIATIANTISGNIFSAIVRLPVQLLSLRAVFSQVMSFVTAVIGQTEGWSSDKITAVGTFARGLGELFNGLGATFKSLAQGDFGTINPVKILKNIVGMELVIYPLRRVLSVISENAAALDESRITAIAQFARFVGEALTALAKVFAEVKYSSAGLGEILKSVFLYGRVTAPLVQLVKIIADIPKGGNLSGSAEFITSIGKFIEKFADLLTSDALSVDPEKIKGVEPFFKAISKLFSNTFKIDTKSLKGLEELASASDQLSNLKGIAETLQALGEITAKGGGGSIDASIFVGLGDGVVKFANSLDQLSDKQLANLIAVADALSKLPVEALQKSLEIDEKPKQDLGEVRDLSNDVASGIKKANFQMVLFHGALALIGGAINLLDPRRPITLLIDGFNAATNALADLKRTALETFSQIEQFGQRIKGFGSGLLTNFGIGNITSSDIFKTTVEFDKLGSSLEVFGGLTKEQRKAAEDYANVLGKEYPLSANEALKATLDLVKAGQSAESAKSILGPAADLASLSDSGSIENATSFIIQATSAFKQFNDTTAAGFENTSVAVNIISSAADASTASVEDLSDALVKVGPVASGMGLSLEETTAALALLADGGIKGAEAGTQLKSLLTSLTTKTAQNELKKLHISLTDTTGAYRPLNDILTDISKKFTQTGTVAYTVTKKLGGEQETQLKAATGALSTAQRNIFLLQNNLTTGALGDPEAVQKKIDNYKKIADNATGLITTISGSEQETQRIVRDISRTEKQNAESLQKIGGSYGAPALSIFLAQGEDGLNNFVGTMNKVAPASERAKKALDNIQGDMIQLQGSVETLTTKALLPLLEKFFRPFVQIGRFVVDTILTMNDSTLEFIATALTLGSALITVVGAVAVLAGGLIELGGASAGLVTFLAFGAKTLTIGLVGGLAGLAAGIATLAAGFLVLAPVLAIITAGFNALSTIFSQNLGGAATQLERLGKRIGDALGQVGTAIGQIIDFISILVNGGDAGSLSDVGKGIGDFFNSVSVSIAKFQVSGAGKALTDIGNIFAGVTKALSFDAGAKKAADDAVGAIDNVNEGFAGKSAREAAKARKAFAKEYAGFLTSLVKNNGVLKSVLGDNLTSEDVQKYLEKAVGYVQTIRTGIGNVFGSFSKAFESAQAVFKTGGLGVAIQTFVTDLGKNLDKSLGGLSANVLDAIGGLFNINTTELSKVFSTKGFAAGAANLIQKGLAELKKLLLSNRDGIKGFLTFVFENLFLGTLNIGKFIADALGQKGIGDFIQGIIDSLKTVFGGLVDTVLNIIAGQDIITALRNAFGPGIQPFLDLVKSLGKAVDNIVGFIGTIFSAIFKPPAGAAPSDKPFLLQLFDGIVEGITGVIDFLNNNILNFLKTGDITGLINNLVNSIGSTIKTLDLPTKFVTAATDILNALVGALKDAFLTIGDVLGFDAQGFLDKIGAAMKTSIDALGKDATPFKIAVTAIQAALVTALNGIFTGIAELLDLDPNGVLDKIDTALQGLVDSITTLFADNKIFDNINLIISNLTFALSGLFRLFSGGDADTATAKIDPLRVALEGLFNFAGNLVATTLDTFKDYIKAFDEFTTFLAKLKPGELLGLTIMLGGLGLAFASYAGVGAILTAVGAGLGVMATGLWAVASPILTIAIPLVVFSQTIRALGQNVGEAEKAFKSLQKLDIAGLLGNISTISFDIFSDLAYNLLGVFGIDNLFGVKIEDFKHISAVIEIYMTQAFYSIGRVVRDLVIQPLNDFITVTIPVIVSELQKLRLQIDAARGDANAQATLNAFGVVDQMTAGGNTDFLKYTAEDFNATLTEALAGGDASRQRLIAQAARGNVELYQQALVSYSAYAGSPENQKSIADNTAKFFAASGILDDALTNAMKDGNVNFFQDIVDAAARQGIDTTEAQKRLADDATSMFNLSLDGASQQAAIDRLNTEIDAIFKATGVTPEVLVKARDDLQAKADALIAVAEGGDGKPVEVPVTVTPDPTVVPQSNDGKLKTAEELKAEMRARAGETPTGDPIELPVGVSPRFQFMPSADGKTPQQKLQEAADQLPTDGSGVAATFDASTLNNPQAVDDFNTSISTLIVNITALGKELNGVVDTQTLVTTTLTNIQTAVTTFRDVTVPLFGEVKLAIDPISGSVQAVNNALIMLFFTASVGFPTTAAAAAISVASIAFSFLTLNTAANTSLQNVINKVKELATGFRDAAAAAALVKLPDGTGGAQPGSSNPPGRASGGSTKPFSVYEVHDTKSPEIYNDGKRSLLLTGAQAGFVTNLGDMPSFGSNRNTGYPGRVAPQIAGPTFNANNITINEGTISVTVQVQGGAAATPQKIAETVKSQVAELQSRLPADKLGHILRTFHK